MSRFSAGLLTLLLSAGLASGCGQKGPLEHPENRVSPVADMAAEPDTVNR